MNRRMIWLVAALGGISLLKLFDNTPTESPVAVVAPVARPASAAEVVPTRTDSVTLAQTSLPPQPLPWPVARDPFQPEPPTAPKEPPRQVVQATPPPPPPPPPAPVPVQVQRPRPAVFGVWRDGTQTRVMLSTPSGVVVAGVGEGVMNFRVETIGSNTVSLLDPGSGERVVLSSPALPRAPAGTNNQ